MGKGFARKAGKKRAVGRPKRREYIIKMNLRQL
jgi:hypothetical protein